MKFKNKDIALIFPLMSLLIKNSQTITKAFPTKRRERKGFTQFLYCIVKGLSTVFDLLHQFI